MLRYKPLLRRMIFVLGVMLVFALQIAAPAQASDPADVLALVNQERISRGIAPLTLCANLTTTAQNHSADMAARDYFSHVTPEGQDPGDRITMAGYNWTAYGENIALNYPSPEAVVAGWMGSAGHKANILDPEFVHMGLGMAIGPYHGLPNYKYWTQTFGSGGSCGGAATDLGVAISDAPDPISAAHNLTYTVVVTNNGASAVTQAALTQQLPSTVTFGSAVPSSGTCSRIGMILSCNLGAINVSASITVTVIVTPSTVGGITSTASVAAAPETDTNTNNNRASATTIILPPPPGIPTLTAPSGSVTASQPTFSWSASTGAVRYEFQLASSNPPTTARVINVTTNSYTPPAPLVAGSYFWWVRAFNASDVPSDSWSAVGSFMLNSPDSSAPLVTFFASLPIILTWNAANGAAAYDIEIADNPAMTSPFISTSTTALTYSTSALSDGTYYWRVRGKNGSSVSAWSSVQSFSLKE